jgi:hypothetical protein
VQFFIAYRLGHDLISNKVGSFQTAKLFAAESFYEVNSDAGAVKPNQVRRPSVCTFVSFLHVLWLSVSCRSVRCNMPARNQAQDHTKRTHLVSS